MAMDGRIVGVTEDLTRRLFHLNPSYETTKCSANSSNVSVEMSNGIIPVSVKYPRTLIDAILDGEELPEDVMEKCLAGGSEAEEGIEAKEISEDEDQELEYEENSENEEGTPEENKTKKSKVIRRKKK